MPKAESHASAHRGIVRGMPWRVPKASFRSLLTRAPRWGLLSLTVLVSACQCGSGSTSSTSNASAAASEGSARSARDAKPTTSVSAEDLIPEDVAASDSDAALIRHMQLAGLDLSKPRELEFFLYFQSKEAADAACQSAAAHMERVMVEPPDENVTSWTCKCWASAVVTLPTIHRFGAELERIATAGGGDYDGWEVDAR